MTTNEPPPPERGLTRAERGRDVSAAQAEAETEISTGRRLLSSMSPRFVWSQADGYPIVIKQFLQFCLILIYPAMFALVAAYFVVWPFAKLGYGILWLIFWPVRQNQKKKDPEGYAASQKK